MNENRNTDLIRVLRIEPGKAPAVTEISSSLESLQHQVEGYIECVYPFDDPVGLIVNEEGKLNCMELNRALKDENGEIYDIIAGPFIIVGLTDDSFCGLSDEYVEKYSKEFEKPELFVRIDGKIHVLPIEIAPVIDSKDCPEIGKNEGKESQTAKTEQDEKGSRNGDEGKNEKTAHDTRKSDDAR